MPGRYNMACHLFQKPFLQFLIPCTQIEHSKYFCSCAYESMFDKSNVDFHYERLHAFIEPIHKSNIDFCYDSMTDP